MPEPSCAGKDSEAYNLIPQPAQPACARNLISANKALPVYRLRSGILFLRRWFLVAIQGHPER